MSALRRRIGGPGRAATRGVWLLLAGLLASASAARADEAPTMEILSNTYIGDFDPAHPGEEIACEYVVTNTSPPGVQNNMIEFVLPAGSNQGIYDVVPADEWVVEAIEADRIVFRGFMPPGGSGVGNFYLYSTCLNVGQEYATATASGIGVPEPFNPVLVNVPTVRGDMNRDGQVNAADLEAFGACMTGPQHTGGLSVECARGDLAPDSSIDLADFAELQLACGSGVQP